MVQPRAASLSPPCPSLPLMLVDCLSLLSWQVFHLPFFFLEKHLVVKERVYQVSK